MGLPNKLSSTQSYFLAIGNIESDVVFVTRFNTSNTTVVYVHFNDYLDTITIYPVACSAIKTMEVHDNRTQQLIIVEGNRYRIEELYLVKGSAVEFYFSISPSTNLTGCVATVFIFQNYTSYQEFRFQEAIISYCIHPDPGTVNFTLSAIEKDQYYYITILSSTYTMTLNYIIIEDRVQYDTTDVTPVICTLVSSTSCSITFSRYVSIPYYQPNKQACILARVSTPVEVQLTAQRETHTIFKIVGSAFLFILSLVALIMGAWLILLCIHNCCFVQL